ncbi:MAG: VCBS repeat-containing protein, partial [Patescibacteria group bacterium]
RNRKHRTRDARTGDNGIRSLLSSVTETGRHETGATVTLPSTQFTYQRSSDTWIEDTNYSTSTMPAFIDNISDNGARIADINDDALADILHMEATGAVKKAFINDGDGTGWTEDTGYDFSNISYYIVDGSGSDDGVRVFDINGDTFADIFRNRESRNNDHLYLNEGDTTGWTEDTRYSTSTIPDFISQNGFDTGVRIFDINGDGLVDLMRMHSSGSIKHVYINNGNGTGWTEDTGYDLTNLPYFVNSSGGDDGMRIADINGDGLADLMRLYSGGGSSNGVFINDGDSTGWTKNTSYDLSNVSSFVDGSGNDDGLRLMDLNADGLADLIRIRQDADNNRVWINDGDGTGWTEDTNYATSTLPYFISINGYDSGVRIID